MSEVNDAAIAEIAGRMFDGDLVRQPQRVQDRVWRDARAALFAALAHLTDDGVALPVRRDGEGPLAVAPSSPHRYRLAWLSARRRALYASKAFFAEARAARELEGATPAIDRESLVALMNAHPIEAFNGSQVVCECNLTWVTNAEYRAHLADAVLALIGVPNSGRSEDDR